MAHEEAARRADGVDEAEADIAQNTQGRDVVGKEPVQAVHRERHDERIETAPALVFLQRIERTDVETQARGIENDFAERRRILETEIEPLPSDRMNAVRRITCESETRL